MNKIKSFRSLKSLSLVLVPLAMAAAPLQAAHAASSGSDAELIARVQAALAATPQAEDLKDVAVSVRDGVVQLRGWVDEPREADLATRVARATDGTVLVDNRIRSWSSTDYQ